MTTASCRCADGHTFASRVTEDDPSVNAFSVVDDACPECGADFEVVDIDYDEE